MCLGPITSDPVSNTITHMGSFGSTVLDQIIICGFPWVVSASEV
jgi:hypothetical protein